ncbi:MAG: hypothetical protein M1812_003646 [Candelaria pacifica]|nr:MAG: hypothetical protein M1812_003646 [Candelaria pacifica]
MPSQSASAPNLSYCVGCYQDIVNPRRHKDHHIGNLPYLRSGQNQVPELRPSSHPAHQISSAMQLFLNRPIEHRAPVQNEATSHLWLRLGSQQTPSSAGKGGSTYACQAQLIRSPDAKHRSLGVHFGALLHNLRGLHPNDIDTIIQWYFGLFDGFLFGGLLGSRDGTTRVVRQELNLNILGTTHLTLSYEEQSDPRVKIALDLDLGPSDTSASINELDEVLETLLHEMVHAVFQIYHCHCDDCLRKEYCTREIGYTGHGEAWADVARAVEDAANRWAGGLHSFDLGIAFHVELERKARALASKRSADSTLKEVVKSVKEEF